MKKFPLKLSARTLWLGVLIVAIAAAAGFYWWRTSQTVPTSSGNGPAAFGKRGPGGGGMNGPVPVKIAPARTMDVGVYLSALGTVTSPSTATVLPLVDGQLMKVLFSEGQTVQAGQLLAVIDPRPYQATLEQMEGQYARDQALLKNAQVDLERYRTLFAQDSIAQQQLATQEALVRQYEGTLKADRGQVANARLQLSYTNITAPISGRIGLRLVDPGNIVHASGSSGLFVITQLQPISVIFTITQDNISRVIKQWQAGVRLPVDAYDRAQQVKLASGYLLSVDNQIDTTTGTVKLRAQFDNTDLSLFPNQFVNVQLLVDTLKDATVIPVAAVLRGTQGNFVYVVKPDQSVTVRAITTGPSDDNGQNVSVQNGLSPGEQVVIDGTDRLREGAKISAISPDSGAQNSAAPDAGNKRTHHHHGAWTKDNSSGQAGGTDSGNGKKGPSPAGQPKGNPPGEAGSSRKVQE